MGHYQVYKVYSHVLIVPLLLLTSVVAVSAQSSKRGGQDQRAIKVVPMDSTVPTSERRTALVIGNANYAKGPLKNPTNDAAGMTAALQQMGFQVTPLYDANRRTMMEAIEAFRKQLGPGVVGLFFFAGHGLQVQGENYLVPLGANIEREQDVEYETVPVGRILGVMEDAGNETNIIILDACRDNPFARSFRSSQQGLAPLARSLNGSLIAYATSPGKTAADGSGSNGVYTSHLLRNMSTPGLSAGDVFMNVRIGVQQETNGKQTPWESVSLTRRFAFVPSGEARPVGPPPPDRKELPQPVSPTGSTPPGPVAALTPGPVIPPPQAKSIYIDYDNDSRYLVPYLEEQMREKKLTVMKKYDGNPQTLKVLLRSTVATDTAFQTKMARISVNLSVQNSSGTELFQDTQSARGSSSTNYEQALQDASQIWASTVKQKGMIERILRSQ